MCHLVPHHLSLEHSYECPIVPAPGDYDDGKFGGMKIGRGNRSTRKKTCPGATLSTTNPT
jgi:hypothetical protein